MSNAFHRWTDVKALQAGKMVRPHFAILQTSDICNQHCHGCAYGDLSGKYMPLVKHLQAIDILAGVGVKAFDLCGGGEPLAMPGAVEIIRYCGSRGAKVGLVTNGTLLNGDVFSAMADYGTYIRVSLEASNAAAYAAYKGVPADQYYRVMKNIALAVKYMRSAGSKCDVGVKFGVGKSLRGQQHFRQGIRLGQEIGASRITFKALRHEPEELSPADKEQEEFLLQHELELAGVKNVVHWILPAKDIPQCYLNPLHAVLDWQGNVYICCYYYFRREAHRLFNIFDAGFENAWFDPAHWAKIRAINKAECARVDCKFFAHHAATDRSGNGGIYFL